MGISSFEIPGFDWSSRLQLFLLYLTRVSSLFMIAPIFSSPLIPKRVKIGFIFITSLVLFLPMWASPFVAIPWEIPIVIAIMKEAIIGLLLGLTVAAIFSALDMAGEMLSLEMGLGIARVLNPATATQTQLLSQFLNTLGLLLFFAMNGHHWFLEGLAMSFKGIPPGTWIDLKGSVQQLVHSFSEIFIYAARISLPPLILLFLSSVSMALLSKTVPQLNILDLGFPMRIITGFAAFVVLLPYMVPVIKNLFYYSRSALFQIAAP